MPAGDGDELVANLDQSLISFGREGEKPTAQNALDSTIRRSGRVKYQLIKKTADLLILWDFFAVCLKTPSLDPKTAEQIGKTINQLKGQVTVLFIAHQLPAGLLVDFGVRLGSLKKEYGGAAAMTTV